MKLKPTFIPAIFWFIIVTILLTLPGQDLPKEEWLDKIGFDKWVHIGLFAIMVFLWCWGILRKQYGYKRLITSFILISLGWVAYGVGMEFVQKYFIPNRSFEIADMVADTAGCLVGLIFSIYRFIKK